jgi:3-phosphoshikimate 1-carboxyvinyltransferase
VELIIIPPERVEGEITPPSSKSYTHRAVFLSLLCNGTTTINNLLISSDTNATLRAFKLFGGKISENKFLGKGLPSSTSKIIDCKNSGTTLRIACSVAALAKGITILSGSKSLCKRPIWPLESALNSLGIETISKEGFPPIAIKGGKIKNNEVNILGNISSQYISGLLIISPKIGLKINVIGDLVSETYVKLTIKMMNEFSVEVNHENNSFYVEKQDYKPTEINIPADLSSASFFIAAGLLKGKVKLWNTFKDPYQADSEFIDIVKRMNGRIYEGENYIEAQESNLEATEINCKNCPDSVPILSVIAAKAKGTTRIKGIEHLRYKESNRIETVAFNLRRLGVEVKTDNDYIEIKGKEEFKSATFQSFGDHRIAMAFSIASLVAKDSCIIKGIECIKDSYPNFLSDLLKVGVKYHVG